ncbi:MAG TPA: peptidylprolyl isomerase [Erysipelothrix sp.]|nr:peptidylprolyl isomerase [Erysipelothrix sp.]
MLEQIKKNWFVVVVALILLVASGFYINDQMKSVVRGKRVDGQQVVFSIAGDIFLVEDYQNELNELLGDSAMYQIFERELLNSLEISEDEAVDAKLRAESTINYIKQSQGSKGLEALERDLKALGYEGIDSFVTYNENLTKYQNLVKAHFLNNYDRLFKQYVENDKPRLVKHILVSMEDVENPTEAELKKMETIEEALADGKKFEEIATNYSDDTETAKNGGSIGVVDANSSLVPQFLEAMLSLEASETSGWIDTQYGKHLIYVEETDFEKLLNDTNYFGELTEEYNKEVGQALWDITKNLDIEFHNSDVENKIKNLLGIDKEEA